VRRRGSVGVRVRGRVGGGGVKGYLWYCVSERALGLGLGLGLGVGVGVKGYLWYCVSERAWSTSVRASAERPLMATPMCESTW